MFSATKPIQPSEFLKMLGHDVRWQLVTTLAQSDFRVQELVKQLQQPQNLVSYHLKQLRDSHLLAEHRSTADARDIYYSLNLVQLQAAYNAVGMALHPALSSTTTDYTFAHPIRILFLCTENSARSQIAEGLLRHLKIEGVDVFSAGTTPSRVHPNAVRVMSNRGIDITEQRSKSVDEFQGQAFDYVITVCDRARENCPVFPNDTRLIHWSLPDPAMVVDQAAQDKAFEQTVQEITLRIRYLFAFISTTKDAPR